MVGVYYIANKLNGKMYIGKSKNIEARIKRHFVKNAKSNNMYVEMGKYGVNNFVWGVIDQCGLDVLDDLEIFYINAYKSHVYGYNVINTKYAAQCEKVRNHIKQWSNTDEQKKQRSERMKEKYKDVAFKHANKEQLKAANKKHSYLSSTDKNYKKFFSERCSSNRPNKKSVTMLNKKTLEPIKTFEKLEDAAIYIRENCKYPKADYSTIRKAATIEGRSAYGYKWLICDKTQETIRKE